MEGKLLLEPTNLDFEAKGVLNPAAVGVGEDTHLFYRAIGRDDRSSIGYCRVTDKEVVERWDKPIMVPEFEWERMGMEDPRITYFEGVYYMLYTAFDGLSARVALAESKDLFNWNKRGLISPSISYDEAEDIFKGSGVLDYRYRFFERMYRQINGEGIMLWEKDAVLFPKRIGGQMLLLHRILPGIQVAYFENWLNLNSSYWKHYLRHLKDYVVMDPSAWFESAYIGAGCPPIELPEGWLLIYHAVEAESFKGKVYRVGVVLLDKDDPQKVIGRMNQPLFEPEKEYEQNGNVNNVVFPTGVVCRDGQLSIYYGCADKKIAVKWVRVDELLTQLR